MVWNHIQKMLKRAHMIELICQIYYDRNQITMSTKEKPVAATRLTSSSDFYSFEGKTGQGSLVPKRQRPAVHGEVLSGDIAGVRAAEEAGHGA